MDKLQSRLLREFQTMKENELAKSILIPLFHTFGYADIDFYGGPSEQGKDLICWRRDELGDIDLGVVQVKRYRPTRRASDSRSFSEIVTQLSQCAETFVPYLDGQRYRPSAIYFVTPHEVDTRTLTMRFERVAALRQFRVKIIDGPKLTTLVRDCIPSLAKSFLGGTLQISDVIAPQLSNQVLMNALGFKARRHIKEFYTDIDIAIGHVSAGAFLTSQFSPRSKRYSLDKNAWEALSPVLNIARSFFSSSLLEEQPSDLDRELGQKLERWETWKEENRRLSRSVQSLEQEVKECRGRLDMKAATTSTDCHAATIAVAQALSDSEGRMTKAVKARFQDLSAESRDKLHAYRSLLRRLANADKRASAHRALEPSVKISFTVTGHSLAKGLVEKREQIRHECKNLNLEQPSPRRLRDFVERCHEAFSVAKTVLDSNIVADVLKVTPSGESVASFTRLSFPIDTVFDTGLNIVVLGEAGAGKTTALQMYAFRHYESVKHNILVIFAPLSQVVRFVPVQTVAETKASSCALDAGIIGFLNSLGASYTLDDFQQDANRGGLVLLDSIDEAYTTAPWVIDSLVTFVEKYPKVQLITSSRFSGEFAERIPFVGVRLMPFTDSQQLQFVISWFGDDPEHHVDTVCTHLEKNPEVSEVVRNPLLATAMCVLQENNVPLPTSEIRLYQEWLSLLIGVYDIHKKISRIDSPKHYLELLAEKIAFRLQMTGRREAPRDELERFACQVFDRTMDKVESVRVLDELVHPCSVLVPMTWTDRIGFGHLRYQEYLAACELRKNRAIPIGPFVSRSWWKGTLVLFAQMQDSLDWLVDALAEYSIDSVAAENISAMLEGGPHKGRADPKYFLRIKTQLDRDIDRYLDQLADSRLEEELEEW